MWQELPQGQSPWIDVNKLSQIFNDTTNSYKYFFFLSLLDLVGKIYPQPSSLPQGSASNIPNASNTDLNSAPEPLAIPLYTVLWHMLELAFTPIAEFHVRLPFQDRLPRLINALNTRLNTTGTTLTNLQRNNTLTFLGQAVLQDLCTSPKQRHLNWPQLTNGNFSPLLNQQTHAAFFPQDSCMSVLIRLPKHTALASKLELNADGEYAFTFAGNLHELEQNAEFAQLSSFVQQQTYKRNNAGLANIEQANLDQGNLKHGKPHDICKICQDLGFEVQIYNNPASPTETHTQTQPSLLLSKELSSQDSTLEESKLDYKEFLGEFVSLEKYVPFRLLKPWIGSQDTKAKFTHLEQVLSDTSSALDLGLPYYLGQVPSFKIASKFLSKDPSYEKINPQHLVKVVLINPRWLTYLQQHQEILQSFAYHKLALRLENLNPLMPALLAKLLPQDKRSALTKQHEYFSFYLQQAHGNRALEPLYDIYTQQPLSLHADYALDHFLPWSFVHHDLIWNLTPITPELNSSKSNQLPPEKFIARLAQQQQALLRFYVKAAQEELLIKASQNKNAKSFKHVDPEAGNYLGRFNLFVNDFLQLGQGYSVQELSQCSSKDFYYLLADQIKPALQIAANQGFSQWHY